MASPAPGTALKTHTLLTTAATTNATGVKAGNGTVRRIIGMSKAATDKFLKIYDKPSTPTVGTDTPRMTFLLPAGAGFAFDLDDYFGQGIAFAITGAAAVADTTAVAVGDIQCLNICYL